MITNAYTIYDRKALNYSPPFFAVADGAALRSFQDLANDLNTTVGRHPADFVLYACGAFDDAAGELHPARHKHIADAISLVNHPSPLPFDPRPSAAARASVEPDPDAAEVRFNGSGV